MVTDNKLKKTVEKILNSRMEDLEKGSLTKKDVRRAVEKDLELEKKSLDERKKFIGQCIQEFIDGHGQDEEETEPEEPPKKRRKKTHKPAPPPKPKEPEVPVKKVIKCRITTPGGIAAPKKGVKDMQRDIMTGAEFLEAAKPYKVEIFGNGCEAFPRSFSSGNRGWWGGGKVYIPVGKHKVWAQLGINLTIIGSKEWETEDE